MLKIMFLCTGNSCRSQMAEGIARVLGKGLIEPYSAGVMPSTIHPKTIQVMNEIDVDISNQTSKGIDEGLLHKMDMIITLCSSAEAMCPMTPARIKRIHWPIDDPVMAAGTEQEITKAFRKARDEIKKLIAKLIQDVQHDPEAIRRADKGTMTTFKITSDPAEGKDR